MPEVVATPVVTWREEGFLTRPPHHRTGFEAEIRGVGGGVDTGDNGVVGGIFDLTAGLLNRI